MAIADIRSLDIAMLRTFDALLHQRSVSRAAERLFLSQPAVSASLKRLRDTFGDPLFTRTGHGVLPTPRALALAPQVEAVLREIHKLLSAERGFDPVQSDRIFRVAASDHAGSLMLPALCRELAATGSRIRLFWESANYAVLGERLHKGEIDIGVLPRTAPPGDLRAEALYEDAYVGVARHGHPAFADGISLDNFCATPQVFLGYGRSALDDTIDQALARLGRRRHAQVAVTSFAQMADLLAHTDHLAVFPRRIALAHAGTLARHALPLELPNYRLYVCWARRSEEDASVQWLKQQLVRAAGLVADAPLAPRD